MTETNAEVLDRVRRKLRLPAGATVKQVMAAFETDSIRRAAAVGLPPDANLNQIRVAEAAAAVARSARRVAATGALGHEVPAENWHPAAAPVHRQPTSTNKSLDWAPLLAEGDV